MIYTISCTDNHMTYMDNDMTYMNNHMIFTFYRGRKRTSPSLGVSPTASPKPVFRPGLLGATPSSIPPLQNTVIVQPQPGHGVFVQQHIFPTAINPTPSGLVSTHYVPQTTALSTNPAHSLFVPPSTLPSLLVSVIF